VLLLNLREIHVTLVTDSQGIIFHSEGIMKNNARVYRIIASPEISESIIYQGKAMSPEAKQLQAVKGMFENLQIVSSSSSSP